MSKMTNRKKREITMIVLTILGILVTGGVIFLLFSDLIFFPDNDGRDHGSAGKMKNSTLVYTVFAGDSEKEWNPDEDAALMEEIRVKIDEAETFLVKEAVNYGVIPSFISDFKKDDALCTVKTFPVTISEENGMQNLRNEVWKYLDTEVDLISIMKRYDAVNLVVFVCLKNDEAQGGSCMTVTQYEGMNYPYEMCIVGNSQDGTALSRDIYAREMLKCFGAKDYNLEKQKGEISEEALLELKDKIAEDIMFVEDENAATGSESKSRLSELTAYYIGLTENSELRDELHLSRSEYDLNEER